MGEKGWSPTRPIRRRKHALYPDANGGPRRRRAALATSAPRFRVCADMGELCTAPIETQPGVMFTGPNWKQLGSVGSQAAPSWTTALPSGGWAGVSRPHSPSRPGTWEPPRNTHPAQSWHPHPQARPPRRSPRGLLSAPGNALRTRRARPAAGLTPRGTGVQRSARRPGCKQHEEHLPTQRDLRGGRSEHRRVPEVK